MIEKISSLYNKLFEIESKIKRSQLYPIHKKLSLPNDKDIYDFLIETFKFVDSQTILDAGCGVGYGSIKIAQEIKAIVLGISVSPLEIKQANENIVKLGFQNCSFEISSFEQIPKNTFDTILCIESLKHAIPIETSIQSLLTGLKENGRLIIVDDFYLNNNIPNKAAQQLIKDWHLDKLIQSRDLPKCNVTDMTNYVRVKSILFSNIKLLALKLITPFVSQISIGIFRGSVYLDILYKKGEMKYLVCEIKKVN
jgi:cyclopropane fatty-acyl-phospholipid synthase-like methyltransferase